MTTLTQTFQNLIGKPVAPRPAQRRDEALTACRSVAQFGGAGLALHTCRHIAMHVLEELGYFGVAETHDGFGVHGRQQESIASIIFERNADGSSTLQRFVSMKIQVISRTPGAAASQTQMLQLHIAQMAG